jgi:CelD/BcsL family acetyltransferase involved in cellulose biosynthesis
MTLADVLAPGVDADVWPRLWQWLGSHQGPGCARLHLPALTSEAKLAGWLARHAPSLALQRPLEGCARLRCDGSYDELLKAASANHRSNLSRGQKRAAQRGGLRYETHAGTAGVAGAMQHFLAIEASGWKGETGGAVACKPELVAFYAALGAGFGAQGRCEIDLLWLGDRAIATVFWFRTGATLHLQKIAYLEEFAELGPGRLIMAEALRRACADASLDQVSFITRCPWADGWRTEVLPVHAWVLFPDTLAGRLRHRRTLVRERVKAVVKPWLVRLRG